MKITYSILVLMFVAILWTWTQLPEIKTEGRIAQQQLPWLIKTDKQGNSSVFGLTLRQSTTRQAETVFNATARFKLQQDTAGDTLEAHFDNIRIAGHAAHITLTLQASAREIQDIINRASNNTAQPGNGFPATLPDELKPSLYPRSINRITYVPKINIGTDVLRSRFGQAAKIQAVDEKTSYWHYPEKGLSIIHNKEKESVFRYVSPAQFEHYFGKMNPTQKG